MDVERAVEHLLELHARAEARMDRADARMDRFEKQLEATRKLVQAGMKIVVQIGRAQKETERKLKALLEAQAKCDARVDRFIRSLEHGSGNGRRGRIA